MTTTNVITPFYGDGRTTENSMEFLKSLKRGWIGQSTVTDAQKITTFEVYLAASGPAEDWYSELAEVDTATWRALETKFLERWPKIVRNVLTSAEKASELKAYVLKEENLGKKETVGGVLQYTHHIWAREIALKADAIPDTAMLCLEEVWKNMPKALRAKVSKNQKTWAEFRDDVIKVDMTELKEEIEKVKEREEQAKTIKDLQEKVRRQNMQTSPRSQLAGQLGTTYISRPPSPTPAPRGTNYNSARAPRTLTDEERHRKIREGGLPIHPTTDEGRRLHEQQKLDWQTRNPQPALPNEHRPYPLTPGTLPVGSKECFRCGQRPVDGHNQYNCQNTKVPELEFSWRRHAHRLLTQPSIPVHYVAMPGYGPQWSYNPEYQTEQGKGEGPSA